MILVGLTGGIGSGKSMVSTMLAQHGAVIIDGDLIVRELQQPGTPVLIKIVERFGVNVLTEHGELNRAALAAIVFTDSVALASLNGIVHPALAAEVRRRIDAESNTDHVVVLDMPLLAENPRSDLSGVIVVDVDPEVARGRLLERRGMSRSDVDARMSQQATRETRNAIADLIIDNSFDLEHLRHQVDHAWAWICGLSPVDSGTGN
ncbi:MAG: dephospho-CoA kinase [Ilumatobacteraceae bacterium]